MAGFKVTRISEGPVKPASATPEETLPLAWVDRYPTHRGLVESMHIFRSGADAAPAVIRAALGKALAFFYPLAGRIVEGEQAGRPAIRCTADGVYFAEAEADCSLEDVRFLERPLLLPKEDLVPYPGDDRWPVEPHNTIMMMQVLGVCLFIPPRPILSLADADCSSGLDPGTGTRRQAVDLGSTAARAGRQVKSPAGSEKARSP
jgi:hypothetical protein